MARLDNPQRFSKYFGISKEVLKRTGALDPILNADTRLFIDPLLLRRSAAPEIKPAHKAWVTHFGRIIKLLSGSTAPGDAAHRQARRMFDFPEFKGTCLGYGAGITGSGIGPGLRDRLLATAQEIVELGVEDPDFFALMPLIEEDIGADRISDMTTRIIARHLCDYTVRVLRGTRIETQRFVILGTQYRLPVNPFVKDNGDPLPVVLVPRDILRSLPIAMDWSDVAEAAAQNSSLRGTVNRRIAREWRSYRTKADRRAVLLADAQRVNQVLESLKDSDKSGYDPENDREGLTRWLEAGHEIAAMAPANLTLSSKNLAGVRKVVEEILNQFQYAIEKGGWKLLYDDDGNPRHEGFAQLTFGIVADSYCRANNLDISPEVDQGGGPVDFKVSAGYNARVLVELKLSSNKQLIHGYERQLEIYKAGERTTAGYFVVLDNGNGQRQLRRVIKRKTARENASESFSPVFVIDAEPKASASKRR